MVVPTYNERENVPPLVRDLLALGDAIDVWVADDGSPDGTAEAVRALQRVASRFDHRFEFESALLGGAVSGGPKVIHVHPLKTAARDAARVSRMFEQCVRGNIERSTACKFRSHAKKWNAETTTT